MKFFPLCGDAQVGKQDAEDTVNFPKLIKRGRQGRGEREREDENTNFMLKQYVFVVNV